MIEKRTTMGKLIQILLILLMSTTSHAENSQQTAEEVLNNYLNAALKGRYEEAYSHIASTDKKKKDLPSYLKEHKKSTSPLNEVLSNKASFKIISIKESGKSATAIVKHTTPNLESVVPEILSALFGSVLGNKNENELEKVLAEKVEQGIPIKTEQKTYQLLKEENGWKLVLAWKSEQQRRMQRDADLVANNKMKWQTDIEIDEMTDQKIGTISSPTIKGADFKSTPYSITIQCKSEHRELNIEIDWGSKVNASSSNYVQIRFDREKMFEVSVSANGSSNSIHEGKDKTTIIDSMRKKSIMRIKHPKSQVGRFSLVGFNSSFNKACNWWNK